MPDIVREQFKEKVTQIDHRVKNLHFMVQLFVRVMFFDPFRGDPRASHGKVHLKSDDESPHKISQKCAVKQVPKRELKAIKHPAIVPYKTVTNLKAFTMMP